MRRLAVQEREATAQLVAALAEFDARRLYLPAGCWSLFTYCTQVLHMSEHAAFNRIEAARAARRHPEVLGRLAVGDLTLTAVRLLAPHLTATNCERLLQAARHKSKREVEHLVATVRPQPDVPSIVRKLPTPRSNSALGAAPQQHPQRTVRYPRRQPSAQDTRIQRERNAPHRHPRVVRHPRILP